MVSPSKDHGTSTRDEQRPRAASMLLHFNAVSFRRSSGPPTLSSVTLPLHRGEVLGLIGPNGAGKTTLARLAAGLLTPSEGTLTWDPQLRPLKEGPLRDVQLVLQRPSACAHPRLRIWEIIGETLAAHGDGAVRRSFEAATSTRLAAAATGLPLAKDEANSFQTMAGWHGSPNTESSPHQDNTRDRPWLPTLLKHFGLEHRAEAFASELSGGELRRLGLARALLASPQLLILDEPTAGLDAILKIQLIKLLVQWRRPGSSLLWISHDWQVIRAVCSHIAVLDSGHLEDLFPVEAAHSHERSAKTRALLDAWEDVT